MITNIRLISIQEYPKFVETTEAFMMASELLLLRAEVKAAAVMRVVFDRPSTYVNDHGPIRSYDEAVDTRRKAGY